MLGTYAFDAFGLRTGTDSATDPYSGFGGAYGYYADAETGLSLLGHRYYDTGTGRFVNRDPIGYAGGADLYAYTQNNPTNYADPDGLRKIYVSDPTHYTPPFSVSGGKFIGSKTQQVSAYDNRRYTVDIPNSQSLAGNMNFALGLRGGYYGNPFIAQNLLAPFVANNTVGDYGKDFDRYPAGKNCSALAHQRRLGANFNFGAMGAAAGLPLEDLLIGGDVKSLEHVLKLHPQEEQDAIADGFYYFYLTHPQYQAQDGISLPAGFVIHVGPNDYDPN